MRFIQQANLIIMLAMFWALAAVVLMEPFYGIVTALVLALFSLLISVVLRKVAAEQARKMTNDEVIQLNNIINRSGSFVCIWRMEPGKWPVAFVSENAKNILGYSAEDFISGRVQWPAITHPDDVPRLEKEVAGYLEQGVKKWSREYRLITKSDEIKWFSDDNLVLEDSNGKTVRIQAIVRDITDRKKAEEALLFKTMLLEAQSETSIDGILAVDNKGRVILHNKRFGEIWKIPRHILDTKDDKKMLEYVLKQLKDPAEFSRKVAYLYEHKDEKSRDEIEFADGRCFDRFSSPLISAGGKSHGRIWYFRDITERKRMEEEKHRLEERSHKLVDDVFRFIPEGILVFSRKMELLRQNQAFRDLVSGYAKRLGFAEDELENLIIDKVKAGLRDNNIKEIRIARKHETGKQT